MALDITGKEYGTSTVGDPESSGVKHGRPVVVVGYKNRTTTRMKRNKCWSSDLEKEIRLSVCEN